MATFHPTLTPGRTNPNGGAATSGQIAAGHLNRRVAMLQRVDVRDATGGFGQTYPALFTTWANAHPVSGREQFAAGRIDPSTDVIFTMRWRPGVVISTEWRIRFDGFDYDILNVDEIGYREGLSITARARAA